MAGKEAVLVLLDVGSSMYDLVRNKTEGAEPQRRLDLAVECIKLLVQQKMLFNKTHEVGLCVFGSDESEEGSMIEERPIDKPDLTFAKWINELRVRPESKMGGGDLLEAIEQGLYILDEKVGKKKFTKKIFVLTNGAGETSYNKERLLKLGSLIKSHDARVNVIAIDFAEEPEGDQEPSGTPEQLFNAKLLKALTHLCPAKVFPSTIAMSIYQQFRSRSVYPVAKYKGAFEISPDLKLSVVAYTKTTEERLPSLKSYSLVAKSTQEAKSGGIARDRIYFIEDDINMTQVDPDQQIGGFFYGKQLVPVDKTLEENLITKFPKCLKLLGFTSAKNVPRHYYMAGVDMLLPNQDSAEDKKAFATIVRALYELEKVAIVRYVARNAPKRGNQAKLAVLSPHISTNYECMWINQLPTIEDIRDFQFKSLKPATEEQIKAAGSFIEALDLMSATDENGETYEALKPTQTFNPVLQYFYQCLTHRAFNEGSTDLPQLDPRIANYVRPDKGLYDKAAEQIKAFKDTFKLEENELKKPKAKVFWRDLIAQEKEKQEEEEKVSAIKIEEEALKPEGVGKKGLWEEDDAEGIRNVSIVNPIRDFKAMMTNKKADLVESAVEQLKKIIHRLITESFQGNMYDKALECLQELQKGCITEDEGPAFNDFMYELKEKYATGKFEGFWKKVVTNGITLLTKEQCKSSTLTLDDAKKFIAEADIHMAIGKPVVAPKEVVDDLLNDIE